MGVRLHMRLLYDWARERRVMFLAWRKADGGRSTLCTGTGYGISWLGAHMFGTALDFTTLRHLAPVFVPWYDGRSNPTVLVRQTSGLAWAAFVMTD